MPRGLTPIVRVLRRVPAHKRACMHTFMHTCQHLATSDACLRVHIRLLYNVHVLLFMHSSDNPEVTLSSETLYIAILAKGKKTLAKSN